ncbi:hypothetical protein LARI1_G006047 [Lachnellula arida]|uniref:Uncharacterized protein n=1 Tax=Lachnellula arida TaxID=1316785 RepID=A0A8T9BDP8_9HELO|nr:hypothetical protein LARI1_G006047 [Lachnellula arida]
MQNSLTGWLKPASAGALNSSAPKPTSATKRKRSSADEDSYNEPAKTQKLSKKAAPKKAPNGNKGAEQMYKKLIADVGKKVGSLDARVKKQGPNGRSVTSDHYAEAMVKYAKDVKALMEMDARLAFNALLYIGPHAHGDLEASWKMSGYGGTEEPFAELDALMLSIISKLELPSAESTNNSSLPKVSHRWTLEDAEVGVFKTGRPNKQQRGQIERQKAAWVKERHVMAKERREKVDDWINNAVEELKGERDAIKGYGLDGYFVKTIVKLEELQEGRTTKE